MSHILLAVALFGIFTGIFTAVKNAALVREDVLVIGDGRFEKVARRGIEPAGVFGILLVEKPFRLRFVDVEAVDQRHLKCHQWPQ